MRRKLMIAALIMASLCLSGCWNYREIEQLAIVSGLAIDKVDTGLYQFTVEMIDIGAGKETSPKSKIITMTGETMFDAARNSISVTGERLYWSHADILIVSEEIAREGIGTILDWYLRDAETRPDITVAIAQTETAGEILQAPEQKKEVLSTRIADSIKNQKSLPAYPPMEMWEFINHLGGEGIAAWTPAIRLVKSNSDIVPQIEGAAVFRLDRLIGFLSGEDTKYALFVRDEIRGGILVDSLTLENKQGKVSLEIFSSKTSLRPKVEGSHVTMDIKVETTVSIGEVMGDIDVISEKGRNALKKNAEDTLKMHMESIIEKVQKEFGSDIFGFGASIHRNLPGDWERLKGQWDALFPEVDVNITCEILIENSALTTKPVKLKD